LGKKTICGWKLANHGVSPEEVEQVLFNDYDIPVIMRGKENKYLTYGETDSGRFLLVVWVSKYRKTRIITARDMSGLMPAINKHR